MSNGLPSGTVTFLFTDIEGSTRLLRRLGDAYETVLSRHQRLLREAFGAGGGREIDTQGDSFFVAFPRAKGAVAAALAAQRALGKEPWPHGVSVPVRMGMHSAEPTVAAERYVGLAVHRAARICAAGHGGQILLSEATHSLLADDVLPDIRFRDLGAHVLKDIERPERIYQLVVPDLPADFPPPRAERVAPDGDAGMSRHGDALRLVVSEDSVLLREGLTRLLAETGFEVVGAAADAEELLRLVADERPDVAVTDIKMPPTHTDEGLVAAERIRAEHGTVGVLVLSQYLELRYALRLLENYPERAGYLLKDRVSDVAVLADAIRRVAVGECVIDPTIVSRLMSRRRGAGPFADLDEAEQEVLALVAEGRSDEAIAEQVGTAVEDVRPAVAALFARLGLDESPDGVRRMLSVLAFLRS